MNSRIFFAAVLLTATSALGADSGNVLGVWKTAGGDSQLELFPCGESVCGKVVWLKRPTYIDSADGPIGATKTDRRNPDPALRDRPILGLQVMKGLTPKGDGRWGNGTCYDPETGKNYRCKMHLTSPGRLELRGYIGFSLLGRTFVLYR
jgi:uncharacterized protein (DUF2147 family)